MNLKLINKKDLEKNVDIQPSEKIYYGRYPYKVNLLFPIHRKFVLSNDWDNVMEERRARRLQLWNYSNDVDEFCANIFQAGWRQYFTDKVQRLYVRSYQDFIAISNFYSAYLKSVAGPITQEHLSILQSGNTEFVNRENPYFKKFDSILEIVPPWSYGSMSSSERRQMIDDAKEFVLGSIDSEKIKLGRSLYYSAKTYINYDDYETLAPFIKLSFPECSLRLTRCCIPSLSDKYNKQ